MNEPANAEVAGEAVVRWPAERFFWGLLDPRKLGPTAGRPTTEQLGFLFERVLPVPIEEVQCAYVKLADGRVAACAAPRDALTAARESGELEAAIALCPSEVPPFVHSAAAAAAAATGAAGAAGVTAAAGSARDGTSTIDPMDFNLLTGAYLPRSISRWRRHCWMALAAGACGVSLVLALGVWLRDRAIGDAIAGIELRRAALIEEAIPAAGPDQGLPPDLRLTAELRRLEQTRGAHAASSATEAITDISTLLAEVLSVWPKATLAKVDAVTVAPEAIDVRGSAPDAAGAAAVATAMRTLPGWRVPQPQVRAGREGVTFTVRLEREESP